MMRIRTVITSTTLGAVAFSALTACSGGTTGPPASGGEPGALGGAAVGVESTSGGSVESSAASVTPTAMDIRSLDLANTTWLYSVGGFDVPLEVELVGGEATSDGGEFPISYGLGEVVYGDVDGDGDDDAVARINRAQSMGSEGLWYIWLADVAGAVQLKYPIARTGRCATFVELPVIENGAVNLTEYERVPGLDDAIPCSEPGTGLKKRTISISSDGTEMWPVQTHPAAAWGGLCPGTKYNETSPGVSDLWAAPYESAAVTATTSPDGGAMFELQEAPLLQKNGWYPVGVKLAGMANAQGITQLECAWAME
ncbi:hypothetical protein ACX80D_15380 [Arthrobacter sp. Sr24]